MKKTSWIVICILVSLALAGCSGSKESSTDKGSGDSKGSGGTLLYGRGADSTALDPAITTEGESFIVTEQIFETLVNYKEDSTEIEAGLAKTWDVSDDGLTYTFHLRDGIKFHDGTDFNAEAVVKNFQRWAQSKDEAKFAYYASMFGGFEGDEGHVIKEVKAQDEHTVVFTLNRPQAPFLKNLAMGMFAIASPAALDKYGDDFTKNPVGTGPLRL